MHFHPNELYLLYDPSTSVGKQVRAYASSICQHVNDFDIRKVHITKTLWEELVEMLDMPPKKLLDKSNPEYQEKIRGNTFSEDGWLKVLQNNPHLIKAPIAVYRNHALLCEQATDLYKLDISPAARV